MKAKTIAFPISIVLATVTFAFAQNLEMGTWKLNEAKSKLAGKARNNTVVYEAVGDQIKVIVDGVDESGNPVHHEWTGKFDGKDYPVTGVSDTDTRSYKKVNSRTLDLTNKKNGKPTLTAKIVMSANGKSRTITSIATDPNGKKITNVAVYDKQ